MSETAIDIGGGDQSTAVAAPRSSMRMLAWAAIGWLGFLAVWQIVAIRLAGTVMPGPGTVAAEMWHIVSSGLFIEHVPYTLMKTLLGYFVAFLIAAPIGYAMGRHDYWRAFFHDGVTVAGTVPVMIYAVLSLVIFGISLQGPVLAVALVCMPYVAINVAEGIRDVDKELTAMSLAFGRTARQVRRHVFIPSVVPYLFSTARMTFAVAWRVAALTEVFGGSNGIGFEIRRSYITFSMTGVLAWMFLFIALMIVFERVVLLRLERSLFAWRQTESV